MAVRIAAARTGAELIALHQRYPGDTIAGWAHTLGDGVLAQLGGTGGNLVTFHVPGLGPHTLHVYDGAPERFSAWSSEPGIVLPETTIVGDPGRADAVAAFAGPPPATLPGADPPRPPPASAPARSSAPLVFLAIAVVVVFVFGGKFGGKS